MKLTITEPISGATSLLEAADEITVVTLRALLAAEFNILPECQQLFVNSRVLEKAENDKPLKDVPLLDGDVVLVVDTRTAQLPNRNSLWEQNMGTSPGRAVEALRNFRLPSTTRLETEHRSLYHSLDGEFDRRIHEEVEALLSRMENDPAFLGVLSLEHPDLSAALRLRDRDKVVSALKKEHEKQQQARVDEERRLTDAVANPLDPESQRFMLQVIQQRGIEDSLFRAQEHLPESFGNVFMLYVQLEVNGIKLNAFVDSGAQATLMSKRCAERCNLIRLVDRRFSGIAQGVGTSRIIGRIHLTQIKMGSHFFAASVTVLEDDKIDFLFGLDLLRRHQCMIDLKANVLKIGVESIPFLSEMDIKGEMLRLGAPLRSSQGILRIPPEGTVAAPAPVDIALPSLSRSQREDVESRGASAGRREMDEIKIKQITDFGFSRSSAIHALESTSWNIELAVAILFQRGDPFQQSMM